MYRAAAIIVAICLGLNATALHAQEASAPLVLEAHSDRVDAVAWLSNERLASGSSDKTIKIWDVASGNAERTLADLADSVLTIAAHPEGQLLASGGKDRKVMLWDLSASEPPKEVANHGKAVYCVEFSPDGKLLASCGEDDTRIKIWNVAEAKSAKELNAEDADDKNQRRSIFRATFTPDSKQLVSCGADRSLRLWDVESGQEAKRFAAIEYLVYTEKDKKIERTAKQGASDSALYCVACSADGALIAAGGADKTIRIWDRASGELRQTIRGHSDYIYGLAFAGADRLCSCGHTGKVSLWNSSNGDPVATWKLPAFALQMALSPNGALLAIGCVDGKIYLQPLRD